MIDMKLKHLKASLAASLFVLVLFAGCNQNGSTDITTGTVDPTATALTDMVLQVNGEGVSSTEFESELARYQTAMLELGREVSDGEAYQDVLDDLIALMLLAQGAEEQGYSVQDADLQQRIDRLIDDVGGAEAFADWLQENGFNDETFRRSLARAVAAGWMRDQIMGTVGTTAEQVHVRRILLFSEEEALSVLNELHAGEDFDTLAALYDPVAKGELGWFPRGYIPEPAIEEAAFSLQPGQYSGVIETSVGYCIVLVIEVDFDRNLTPDALLLLQGLALENWLQQEREQSTIIISP